MKVVCKLPECAICEHCEDILYEDDLGPFSFICKYKFIGYHCQKNDKTINDIWVEYENDGPIKKCPYNVQLELYSKLKSKQEEK